jgi:HAAS domain-containing protein
MLTGTQTARIDRYLEALERAMAAAPPDERAEVVAGVREHIDAALADLTEPTDADVDAVLHQLGDPVTIATTASGRDPAPAAGVGDAGPLTRDWLPIVVVLLMAVGVTFFFLVFPLLLWLAGVVLLWASPLWRLTEKLWGTLVPLAALVAVVGPFLTTFFSSAQSCSASSTQPEPVCTGSATPAAVVALSWVLFAAVLIAAVVALAVLARRGTRRAARIGVPTRSN